MIVTVLAIFVAVIMPLYAVYLAWTIRRGGRSAWLMRAVGAVGFMAFLTLVARWDFLSAYLVWFWWALVAVMIVLGFIAVRKRGWVYHEKRGTLIAIAFEPLIALGLFGYAALGLFHGGAAAELAWPLRDGRFVVGQGGNSPMLNYHNTHPTQRYALDIGELDDFGRRADGIMPAELSSYVIYGAQIVSPCAGSVIEVRDDLPDNAIESTNRDEPAGNRVAIACDAIEVVLAHMQPGSVAVSAGESVTAGQPLGLVGNSGNSTEPHLHIHAVREGTGGHADGEPVPMTFRGIFPVRNTVIEN
jgi:hypothetical protein